MPSYRNIAALITLAVLAAACSSSGGGTRTLDPRTWFSSGSDKPGATPREVPGVDARLRPVGSALSGAVRVRESGDLLIVRIELANVKPGAMHRAVFHSNGNCSSPNGFSAGPPWTPPGSRESPGRVLPEIYANTEGDAILTARLRGVRLGGEGGLENRSVLIYEGSSTVPPQPGVPNNVIGCGVFERATMLFQ